jgi:hypothetical protein
MNVLLAPCRGSRLNDWLLALLHELVLWAANRVDQHVRSSVRGQYLLTYVHFRMSLQSAIIGFFVSKILAIPITPQENVVIQTTAVATGTVRHLLCPPSQ